MQQLFPRAQDDDSPAADAPAGVYVRIAVERGIDSAEAGEGLTYRAGPLDLRIGQRVEVPLGRGNKPAAGIVVEVGGPDLLGAVPPAKVKPVLRALSAALPPRLVELAQWMADYYICPLGIVMGTMLPASVKHGTGLRRKVEVEPVSPSEAASLLEQMRLAPAARRAWEAISDLAPARPMDPHALAAAIQAKNLGPINRLVEAGLLRKVERQVVRGKEQIWQTTSVEQLGPPPELTAAQRVVAEGISAALGRFGVHLIRGITGSGKTEVYMRVIARVLDARQRALVLVPEIALTPQTAGRFIARFAPAADEGRVAVLHSGMPASERHRQWALAASGRARVVVGARSAIFAPLADLGLVIVDEEHASDYKQDQAPRYNGRDVAIKRAQLEGCPIILGSATPSLESWANAVQRAQGRGAGAPKAGGPTHYLWELTERVGGGVLPRVEVVDLAVERRMMAAAAARDGGNPREIRAVGPRLEDALRQTIDDGGQAILLLNRRGFSSYICCSDPRCGWVAGCDQCDAAMVLHRGRETEKRRDGESGHGGGAQREFVRCHHCLSEQLVPRQCAVCNRKTIMLGVGTQRLEDELARRMSDVLPPGRVVRVDGDSMRSASDYFRVLSRFSAGEIAVLLGTQMIAKGLDFPNVRLVGVINADTGLSIPDFRAAERTFQLVSQVAGRAGRAGGGGRVIVQTINPEEPAIVLASRHDYIAFARREWAVRQRAGMPPITRMARIVVKDESPSKAQGWADEIATALREAAKALQIKSMVVGPAPCAISRIANEYRFSVELVAGTARDLHTILAAARRAGKLSVQMHAAVDVDPVALM